MEEFPNSTPISHPIPPSSQLSLQALLEMNQVETYETMQCSSTALTTSSCSCSLKTRLDQATLPTSCQLIKHAALH